MPKKPTGQLGPIRIQNGPDGVAGNWNKIKFPDSKEDIEELVMKMFAAIWLKHQGITVIYKKNPENGMDYTIVSPGGPASIELTEAIYRDEEGRPYDSREIKIYYYRYAEQILAAIKKKSEHYGRISKMPADLLIYITHWRFHPHQTVIRLVQHFLKSEITIFENIFFLSPLDEIECDLEVLFPSQKHPLEGRQAEEFRDHFCLTMDPQKAQFLKE